MTRLVHEPERVRNAQLFAAGVHKPEVLASEERSALNALERTPGPLGNGERDRLVANAREIMARLVEAGPIPVS